ncbi:MAG: integrase core domain-containing protein, partial [Polyangiaceae bacterium]
MLRVPGYRLAATAVAELAARAMRALRNAGRPSGVASGFIADLTRSRAELITENALLRQQLIVASRAVKRPAFRVHERGLLVLLASVHRQWRHALLLVKPETLLRWHREGFRLFWRQKSRSRWPGEPRVARDVVALIHRMATENRLWGAERIRGELLKLGVGVAKRTVQRYMRGAWPTAPRGGQGWRTFLRNHTVWACDYLQVYDIWFRPVFAFFILDVNAKRVVHVAVTRAPTQAWTAQQLRNATPFGHGPQFIVRDRDDKFGTVFDRVAVGAGARVVRTAVRAPLMNAVCERFLGSVRRECLDHVIILSERHLRHVLAEYAMSYFNTARPHQGIDQRLPVPAERSGTRLAGPVTAIPVLGGLHHDYRAVAWEPRTTKGARTGHRARLGGPRVATHRLRIEPEPGGDPFLAHPGQPLPEHLLDL